ncbi:hypothetical protein GOP47_0019300 [Adiantum capillus-veneris]|uniref:ALOG domain-containing protein n=1 Tax=Adiantum capillus-veneris TaxID=13818 RepID=A0A9D4UG63_ADICA|nr:hypothetical protein GOP47_0019300 [Adiantum capillus-veneris]
MNDEGSFSASDHTCHDTNDQFMINALMMQHQHHHDQFGAVGSYHINCDYQPATAAAASANVPPMPRLQSPGDHHQYGVHLSGVNGALASSAGGFPILGGSSIGPLNPGGILAGPTQSGGGMPVFGSSNSVRIPASGSGIPPCQNGGVRGSCLPTQPVTPPSRYESQKRRDWNTFGQYLRNSKPPLPLSRCNGEHVLQFLRYLDQFGKTKVHGPRCPYFGLPHPPGPCECPLRQAWGSLDALIGRLRAAFEENGGKPESNPFGARQVRLYLREVREHQAKARGIAYEKKKRKRPKPPSGAGTCSNATDTNANFHSEPPAGSSSSSGFLVSGCN